MKKTRKRNRVGTLLFLVPIIFVSAVVLYAALGGAGASNGTLVVEAQSVSKYSSTRSLSVSVTVGGHAGVTPFNLTLTQATYIVTFPAIRWYDEPVPREVNVSGGKTSFVVGQYHPTIDVVSVTQGQFNVTGIVALHGVTPVVWVNPTTEYVTLTGSVTGTMIIPPMQNLTHVFQSAGTYGISIVGSSSPNLIVTVS